MAEPYLGEIRIASFSFPPTGWALCNGQTLLINQNQALFAVLGTTYGGNGVNNFLLPNLQGCVPIHEGNGFTLGQTSGEAAHTLTISEVPTHTHAPVGSSNKGSAGMAGNLPAANSVNPYSPSGSSPMNAASITSVGGSQPHENRQPYLVLNFIIALQGIFPSQN
jgi:microcystin-dependent protein